MKKPTEEELVGLALQTLKLLEESVVDYRNKISFYEAKLSDAESKIRWLKREILKE